MKVHELLTTESRWTKGVFARSEDGDSVSARDEAATCWCFMGAIQKCYGPTNKAMKIMDFVSGIVGNIANWNDASNFQTVRAFCLEHDI